LKHYFINFFYIVLLFFSISSIGTSQEKDKSLAFKKNRPNSKPNIFYQPDLFYQLQKQFNLTRDANAGNPLAQHELGLRYLLGEDGITADTFKGAYWVGKAAGQNLTAACFNFGILLLNGWGVEWNPFQAFDYFLKAAQDGMPQAQHLVGIFYTDNLIVKKDFKEAYKWLEKSSEQNYSPAIETMTELNKIIDSTFLNLKSSNQTDNFAHTQSKKDSSLSSQLGLAFIDFEAIYDTIRDVSDKNLIDDLFQDSNIQLADTLGLKNTDSSLTSISSWRLFVLSEYAESGNPEALAVLGRLYEKGIFQTVDLIKASINYILSSQLSYTRAKILLLRIMSPDFLASLNKEIRNNNPDAMFVLYGLWQLGIYNFITSPEASKLLVDAATMGHTYSQIELGNNFYRSDLNTDDRTQGINIWKQLKNKGNFQAQIRLAAVNVIDSAKIEPISESIKTLKEALRFGSVLAQVSLAYAYEKGIGVPKNKAEASKYYRLSAQRGNISGYKELKRLYDDIRPKEKRFLIN
jgi:hypothetical protein